MDKALLDQMILQGAKPRGIAEGAVSESEQEALASRELGTSARGQGLDCSVNEFVKSNWPELGGAIWSADGVGPRRSSKASPPRKGATQVY